MLSKADVFYLQVEKKALNNQFFKIFNETFKRTRFGLVSFGEYKKWKDL